MIFFKNGVNEEGRNKKNANYIWFILNNLFIKRAIFGSCCGRGFLPDTKKSYWIK